MSQKQTTAERHARRAHRKTHDFTDAQWAEVLRRAGYRCVYCGKLSRHLEVEHLTPIARGGNNDIRNVVPSCRECNAAKGRRSVYELLSAGEVADLHRRLHAPQHPDTVALERLHLRLLRDYLSPATPRDRLVARYALDALAEALGNDHYGADYVDREFPAFQRALRKELAGC